MAHILDGEWKSRTTDLSTVNPEDPPTFILSIDEASGDLKEGSKHGNDPLTGSVSREGQLHRVQIKNVNKRRVYEGVFCATLHPQDIKVMAGKRRSNVQFDGAGNPLPKELAEPTDQNLSKEEIAKLRSQEQIIWIATKP
jgi:hypothetical protein